MKLTNLTRGTVLATEAARACTRAERRRGLIGRSGMAPGEALVFERCRQVHTFGMRFCIDVLFLDCGGKVMACVRKLPPRRLTRVAWRARAAVELPAGTLASTGTVPGDLISPLP